MTIVRLPLTLCIVLCFVAAALPGCWKGGGGTPVTSLDSKSVIGDLDDGQFMRLCRDIDHWNQAEFGSAKFHAALCEIETAATLRQQGASPAGARDTCHTMASQCESARAGMPSFPPQCQRGPERCALTVGDVETCLIDLSYDMNAVLCSAPVCDDLCGFVNERDVQPASCAAVRSACPGLRFTRPSFEWLLQLDPCTDSGPATRVCVWSI
jgi:hypothetical protein